MMNKASYHLFQLEKLLKALVMRESPSDDKARVDALGEFIAGFMRRNGGRVHRFRNKDVGDMWLGEWGKGSGGVLLLGHLDTVWPVGTLVRMPWKKQGGKIFGPGIHDMKAGIAIALQSVRQLHREGQLRGRHVSLLFNGDEEIGSFGSRHIIERLARIHDVTLCLEPALRNGAVKTQRRGVGRYTVAVKGKAAHSGSDPGRGINAIVEMAEQIKRIHTFQNMERGTSVNVGVIRGGTQPNIVPEFCEIKIDIRTSNTKEQKRVVKALYALKPILPGALLMVSGAWHRPVMQRTRAIANAFSHAKRIARSSGIVLEEASVGGSSDANSIAVMNLPVLCGLGPVGAGSHAAHEHVVAKLLPQRAMLLSALIARWPIRKIR